METTERIVEAYVRHVKGWATIPNVRCDGQNEIDLLAIDPKTCARSHIEVSISISQGFRKLTNKTFDPELVKQRVHLASQRRTLGFFVQRKFSPASVLSRLAEYGFEPGKYSRVIVTWGWEDGVAEAAERDGIELWDFRGMMREIADEIDGSREYFADDTLRTLNLFAHASAEAKKGGAAKAPPARPNPDASAQAGERFWVYVNEPTDKALVHLADCSFCNYGGGVQESRLPSNGKWLGPMSRDAAVRAARSAGKKNTRWCGHCARRLGIEAHI